MQCYYRFLSRYLEIGMGVGIFFTTLFSIYALYIVFRSARYTDKLSKKVYDLGKGITAERAEDFISYLDTRYMPLRFHALDFMRAGYRLIEMDEDIDEELKQKLKVVILSKGVLMD